MAMGEQHRDDEYNIKKSVLQDNIVPKKTPAAQRKAVAKQSTRLQQSARLRKQSTTAKINATAQRLHCPILWLAELCFARITFLWASVAVVFVRVYRSTLCTWDLILRVRFIRLCEFDSFVRPFLVLFYCTFFTRNRDLPPRTFFVLLLWRHGPFALALLGLVLLRQFVPVHIVCILY